MDFTQFFSPNYKFTRVFSIAYFSYPTSFSYVCSQKSSNLFYIFNLWFHGINPGSMKTFDIIEMTSRLLKDLLQSFTYNMEILFVILRLFGNNGFNSLYLMGDLSSSGWWLLFEAKKAPNPLRSLDFS